MAKVIVALMITAALAACLFACIPYGGGQGAGNTDGALPDPCGQSQPALPDEDGSGCNPGIAGGNIKVALSPDADGCGLFVPAAAAGEVRMGSVRGACSAPGIKADIFLPGARDFKNVIKQ